MKNQEIIAERFYPKEDKNPVHKIQNWISFHVNSLIATIAIALLVALPIFTLTVGTSPTRFQGASVSSPTVTPTTTVTPQSIP